MKKVSFLLIPLFFLVFTIKSVYAASDINFGEFGTRLGEALGVGDFVGGIIATFILLMFCLLLLVAASGKSPNTLITLLITFMVLTVGVALAWFPVWSLILLILLIGLLYGKEILRLVKH